MDAVVHRRSHSLVLLPGKQAIPYRRHGVMMYPFMTLNDNTEKWLSTSGIVRLPEL